AAGQSLAVGSEVRCDSVPLGGATEGDTEPRDDFVEDQYHSVPVTELPQPFEVSGPRLDRTGIEHHRFGDDRGDLVTHIFQDVLDDGQIVPGQHDRIIEMRRQLTLTRHLRCAGLIYGHQYVVEPSVILAGEADELVPSSRRPGSSQSPLHGFATTHPK